MTVSEFQTLLERSLEVRCGNSCVIYGLLVACFFMFPNAELAAMFIPVPISTKIFCARFDVTVRWFLV
jgi:membrane associated rhomboid family serine protease